MDSKTKGHFVSLANRKILYRHIIQHVANLGGGLEPFRIGSFSNRGISIVPEIQGFIDTNMRYFSENVAPKPHTMPATRYLLKCNQQFVAMCGQQIAQNINARLQASGTPDDSTAYGYSNDGMMYDVEDDWNDDPFIPSEETKNMPASDIDERFSRIARERRKELRPIRKRGTNKIAQTTVVQARNLNQEREEREERVKKTNRKAAAKRNQKKRQISDSDDDYSSEESDSSDDYSEPSNPVSFQKRIQAAVDRQAGLIGNGASSDDESTTDDDKKSLSPPQKEKKRMVFRGGKKVYVSENTTATAPAPKKKPPTPAPVPQKKASTVRAPAHTPPRNVSEKTMVNIDTRTLVFDTDSNLSEYKIPFAFRNVSSIRLISAEIPKSGFNITKYNNRLFFEEEKDKLIEIAIEPGYYHTFESLRREIEDKMKASGKGLYSVSEDPRTRIVRIGASSDPSAKNSIHHFSLDWTKENTLVDILGFPHQRQSGGLNYRGCRCYSLRGDTYVLLQIPEFQSRFSDGVTFSKIILDVPENEVKYYQPATDIVEFQTPKSFKAISICFRRFDGTPYQFHDQHHSLTFEVNRGRE